MYSEKTAPDAEAIAITIHTPSTPIIAIWLRTSPKETCPATTASRERYESDVSSTSVCQTAPGQPKTPGNGLAQGFFWLNRRFWFYGLIGHNASLPATRYNVNHEANEKSAESAAEACFTGLFRFKSVLRSLFSEAVR